MTINVVSGVEELIRVTYEVYCRAGSPLSSETIAREINKAIDRYFADFPMGGEGAIPPMAPALPNPYPTGTRWMYLDKLRAVIIGALDEVPGVVNPVFHATVSTTKDTNANGDIEFAPGEIAVHYLDPIASVVRV